MAAQTAPGIELGRRPRIKQAEHRDLRKHATIPLRAFTDKRVGHAALKVLGIICSYANRAGLLWVGQRKLAQDLGVSFQAVNRQVGKLKRLGYLETVYRGYRGEKADTLRVVFDPSISTTDAVALASTVEDCRAPRMIERDEYMAFLESEEPMPRRTKKKTQVDSVKLSGVDRPLRLTIDEVLREETKVTEADMSALERAIEAGLTRSRWLSGRDALPDAPLREVLAWCNGANEGMPANKR
jgi:DNA-binding transcriptional MocR family regulator